MRGKDGINQIQSQTKMEDARPALQKMLGWKKSRVWIKWDFLRNFNVIFAQASFQSRNN